jgi:hypothetical protein
VSAPTAESSCQLNTQGSDMHLNIVIYFLLIFCAVLEAQQPPFYSNIYAWL